MFLTAASKRFNSKMLTRIVHEDVEGYDKLVYGFGVAVCWLKERCTSCSSGFIFGETQILLTMNLSKSLSSLTAVSFGFLEASFWKSYATFIRSFSIWEFVFFGLQNTVCVVFFQLSIDFAAEWVICSAGKHVVMCSVILSEMDQLMWFFSVIIITELLSSSTLRSTGIYLITSPKSHVDWIFRDSYIVTL